MSTASLIHPVTGRPIKLGRTRARRNGQSRLLASRLHNFLSLLPDDAAPAICDYTSGIAQWGEMLNDQLGDCVVENTAVSCLGKPQLGYRAYYDGPVVEIVTRSGKNLTVTPKHPVLTNNGFVMANTLKQGDNLVCTCRPDISPRLVGGVGETNFNQSPALIEEVVAALRFGSNSVRKIMPRSIYFNGDGEFVNGDINVVGAQSFLGGEHNITLSEPDRQYQISTTGELKSCFQRLRSSRHTLRRSKSSAFGDVSFGGHRTPLMHSHVGVSQTNGVTQGSRLMAKTFNSFLHQAPSNIRVNANLLHRSTSDIAINSFAQLVYALACTECGNFKRASKLNASLDKPTLQCGRTDAELVGDLFDTMPGLVEFDGVVSVKHNTFRGHVYDLSTPTKWYSANGIITHNCTIAAPGHLIQTWTAASGAEVTVPDAAILKAYEDFDGYVNGDPATDQGGDILTVCQDWEKQGIGDHFISASAEVNMTQMRWQQALWAFGGLNAGVQLPVTAQQQVGGTWDVVGDGKSGNSAPGSWGGHCVAIVRYGPEVVTCVTWGELQDMTWRFVMAYFDECYACISSDWKKMPVDFNGGNILQQMRS